MALRIRRAAHRTRLRAVTSTFWAAVDCALARIHSGRPKELQSRTSVSVDIEGEEKPALVADWIGLIYFA